MEILADLGNLTFSGESPVVPERLGLPWEGPPYHCVDRSSGPNHGIWRLEAMGDCDCRAGCLCLEWKTGKKTAGTHPAAAGGAGGQYWRSVHPRSRL